MEVLNKVDFTALPNNLTPTLADAYAQALKFIFENKWTHATVA